MYLKYQLNYARERPQMYDKASRIQRAKRIVKTLKVHLGKRALSSLSVLDIGGSTGIIANELAKYFKKIVVIDIDKETIEFAKKTFKRKNLSFVVDDALRPSLDDNSFDVVICAHVYEHVPDPKRLFGQIYRILKSGGVCYLAAQNKLWPLEAHHNLLFLSWLPKNIADLYVRIFRGKTEYYERPMTYWQLKRLLKKFKIHDYTQKILGNPENFGYENLAPACLVPTIHFLSPIARYFTPTLFWILEK